MPSVYLSPSLQEYNPYVDGGNEEYYMNLIADAMETYLKASGIDFRRNDPDMTLSQAIADSNKGNHDLHLAIHSNAAPEGSAGRYTGADIYYYPTGSNGKRFAEILQNHLKQGFQLFPLWTIVCRFVRTTKKRPGKPESSQPAAFSASNKT